MQIPSRAEKPSWLLRLVRLVFFICLVFTLVSQRNVLTITSSAPLACSTGGTSTDLPNSHFPIHPNGTLVKTASSPAVFLIDGGRKRGITSQAVLNSLYTNGGFTNTDVITIRTDEMNFYAPGSDVSATLTGNGKSQPDGRLIQANGGSEISVVSNNGHRRPFSSPTRFQNLGYQFCNVILISASDYNSYPADMAVGEFPTLTAPGDNSTNQSLTPTLSWTPVSGVASYRVAVATSVSALPSDPGAFQCPGCVIFESTASTQFQPINTLNPSTQYFWEIEAINVPDFNVWSATRSFTTMAASDGMQLVSTTPSNGTTLATNSLFTTKWQLKNTGQTTWTNSYAATWISTPVDGHDSNNLTSPLRIGSDVPNAAPGATVELSISMIVPPAPGTYFMYWQLQNASGVFFGPRFFVQIAAVQSGDESLGSDGEDFGTGDAPGSNVGMNDDSLNTATGNFNYRVTDLRVPGRGLDFIFGRSYNAKDPTTGPMGVGWSHSFNIFLLLTPNQEVVPVHYADGKVVTFGRSDTGPYKPFSKGFYDTLTKNSDSTWTLLKPDQRELRFDAQGKLTSIRDKNGNQINLTYGADNNLTRVVDTVGRQFSFTYTNSLLTGVTDPINRQLSFQYSGNQLVLFRDARNNSNTFSYDTGGRLSQMVDGRGIRIMSNSYDSQGRLINQTNGRNFTWGMSYNESAGTTTVTDPNQKQIVYSYDSGHKLVGFTNRLTQQNRVSIAYDSNNNRKAVTDPINLTYNYLYDTRNGLVTRSTDPDSKTRNFVYDSRNNPTEATNELNQTTRMGYDNNGNLTTLTDALNSASSVGYDSFGQPTSMTDPNGNLTSLSYDSQGNLISVQDALNNVTQYSYDAVGRRISTIDARGKITKFSYDENDNLISLQRPIGVTLYSYDQADNRISITDPLQHLTTFTYDADNNVLRETDATRVFFVEHAYDALDRRISTRDKRGNTTTFEYDQEGRLTSMTDPLLNRTSYTYDGNGNRLTITDANNQTTRSTYDNLNRVKTTQDALGNIVSNDYDAAGQLTSTTDARGNVTRFTYDSGNNLVSVNDAEGGVTRYSYDKNRNLITQIDPNNHSSSLTYDKLNRLIQTLDPLSNRYDYEYDAVGDRTVQTDAKRQTIRFTYDDNQRLIKILYPDSSSVQLSYDLDDNLTQVIDSLGTTRYTYDQLNRISTYQDAFGKTISYQYDANGNVTTLTYPDNKQVQYTYDKNNRMSSVTDWSGMTVSYSYNSINLLTSITPPSSTDNGGTSYSYDLAGRLTGLTNGHSRGGPNTYSFILDQNGNRTTSNTQEPLNNAVAAKTQSSNYDAANRIQNAGNTTFTFDANGNMTRRSTGSNVTNYSYDFNDRLTSDQVTSFFYNGQGVRLAKSRGGNTTRYVVDVNRELSQVLCETDASGNITSYYVYGQGLIYKVLPSGGHYYYQFDPNGSTISMTTALDFSVNRYAYDPFGIITNKTEVFPNTNTTVPNPFRFGGRYGVMDDDNGLVYVRARYYAPDLGRFLTKDPLTGDLKDGQSLNRYVYAVNNPVRLIDVDGLKPWDIVKAAFKKPDRGSLFQNAADIGSNLLSKWGDKGNDLLLSSNPNLPFSLDAKGLGAFGHLVDNGLTAKTILYDNVKEELGISNFSGFVQSTKSAFKNAGANIKSASLNDWAQTFNSVAAISLNSIEDIGTLGFAQYCAACRYHGDTLTAVQQSAVNAVVSAVYQPQIQAQPILAPVKKQTPAVQILPRGPAPIPVQPRGPKPAPISPRGPATTLQGSTITLQGSNINLQGSTITLQGPIMPRGPQ